jgi:hypothetical protein
VFPPQVIDFLQVDDDLNTVPRIVVIDETITNMTGVNWTDYHWAVLDSGDAWLNVPLSRGWTTDPFAGKAFSDPRGVFNDADKATDLVADMGVVFNNTSFFPGAGSGDGEIVMDVDLSEAGPVSFTFKQFPTPEPSTFSLLLLGGLVLPRRRC